MNHWCFRVGLQFLILLIIEWLLRVWLSLASFAIVWSWIKSLTSNSLLGRFSSWILRISFKLRFSIQLSYWKEIFFHFLLSRQFLVLVGLYIQDYFFILESQYSYFYTGIDPLILNIWVSWLVSIAIREYFQIFHANNSIEMLC